MFNFPTDRRNYLGSGTYQIIWVLCLVELSMVIVRMGVLQALEKLNELSDIENRSEWHFMVWVIDSCLSKSPIPYNWGRILSSGVEMIDSVLFLLIRMDGTISGGFERSGPRDAPGRRKDFSGHGDTFSVVRNLISLT